MNGRHMEIDEEDLVNVTTTYVIALTFKIYGVLFLSLFVIYLFLRSRIPLAYNYIHTKREYSTVLAEQTFGHVTWLLKIFSHSDDEVFEHCGLDSLVLMRFLRFGFKLSLVGIFNSIYLIPVNLLACDEDENENESSTCVIDRVDQIGVGNVPPTSKSLLATTFASYVIFFTAMYLVYNEFKWFTTARHKFLSLPRPDNYSVFVRHIPPEFQSDIALKHYFQSIFSKEDVLEARVLLNLPTLDKKVELRESVVESLEHAYNIRRVRGYEPKSLVTVKPPTYELSIPHFSKQLEVLNREITTIIDQITNQKAVDEKKFLLNVKRIEQPSFSGRKELIQRLVGSRMLITKSCSEDSEDCKLLITEEPLCHESEGDEECGKRPNEDANSTWNFTRDSSLLRREACSLAPDCTLETSRSNSDSALQLSVHNGSEQSSSSIEINQSSSSIGQSSVKKHHKKRSTLDSILIKPVRTATATVAATGKKTIDTAKVTGMRTIENVRETGKRTLKTAKSTIITGQKTVKKVSTIILGPSDGNVLDSGFITFTNLMSKSQCLQMIHHESPFQFVVERAPLPKDIFWENVGMPHEKQQVGVILAIGATAGLCLFWTFIVAFLSSFAEVDRLTQSMPFLEDWLVKAPWVAPFLSQMKPLLLILLTNVLPQILKTFCKYEGHISQSSLNASLFIKLSIFQIIQLFFVQAISGSIWAQLDEMLRDWTKIISLLASSVPNQVKAFIQYVLVGVFLGCGMELCQVQRLLLAIARDRFGPNLSEKEKNKNWKFLKPLTSPPELDLPALLSEMMLYTMILLVYSTIAPIMSFIMVLCFSLLRLTYRNQLIYIYPSTQDSGGVLWEKMIKLMMSCIIIAEATLIGILSIKQGLLATTLMIPLVVLTVLFSLYLEQRHYLVTGHLPSTRCKRADISNEGKLDFSFLKGAYDQPSLRVKELKAMEDGRDTINQEEVDFSLVAKDQNESGGIFDASHGVEENELNRFDSDYFTPLSSEAMYTPSSSVRSSQKFVF